MGLFWKKDNNIEEKNEEEKRGEENFNIYLSDQLIDSANRRLEMGMLEKIGTAHHRHGRDCNVYSLKALIYKDDDTIILDYGDDICFEISPDLEKEFLKSKVLKERFIQSLARLYLDEKSDNNEAKRFYFGEMKRINNGTYVLGKKSSKAEETFNEYLTNKTKRMNKQYEEKAKKEYSEFIKRTKVDEEEYKKKQEEIRRRADNPYFDCVNKNIGQDGKVRYDYEGINTSDSELRGYIIRLQNVEKIGKDGSGTYLYSGRIENTSDIDNAQIFYDFSCNNICFELYGRLDDIMNSGNPKEINALLKFFSNPKSDNDNRELKYIGGLEKIDGEMVEFRGEEPLSSAIAYKVKGMQKEYKDKMQNMDDQIH